jgi:CheY-like chemotaxis protein
MVAKTGDEALLLLEHEDVDVVFADVIMPGLSVVELAEALRQARPELPIVLATKSFAISKGRSVSCCTSDYRFMQPTSATARDADWSVAN